jgi:hypothetical protein
MSTFHVMNFDVQLYIELRSAPSYTLFVHLRRLRKFAKTTVNYLMSIRMQDMGLQPDRFSENFILEDFTKICHDNDF